MDRGHKESPLGFYIKQILEQRSLSLRKFSGLTAIDSATISRIINGKRKATPEHLQRFAHCLEVPASDLFIAAGYPVQPGLTEMQSSVADIQHIFASSDIDIAPFRNEDIERELARYEQFSQTEEGKATIDEAFEKKLLAIGGSGPFIDRLKAMYESFSANKGTWMERALIGSALIYFIIPIDLVPDYLFPIGYLDDAIAVNLIVRRLQANRSSLI